MIRMKVGGKMRTDDVLKLNSTLCVPHESPQSDSEVNEVLRCVCVWAGTRGLHVLTTARPSRCILRLIHDVPDQSHGALAAAFRLLTW